MTYPPTGSNPSQDPNQGPSPEWGAQVPTTGSQPTADWSAQAPVTGAQQQWGQPQGVPQGYGQPPYGGYGTPPGFGAPSGARPGSATAAAVLSFIFGSVGVIGYGWSLIGLTGATEGSSGLFSDAQSGFSIVLLYLWAVLGMVSAILVFIGAVQLLGGSTNKFVVIACILYFVAQLCFVIATLVAGSGDGVATMLVIFLVSCLFAAILLYLAKSRDVEKWLARKAQARAAGYED